jgi:hypothetical protein
VTSDNVRGERLHREQEGCEMRWWHIERDLVATQQPARVDKRSSNREQEEHDVRWQCKVRCGCGEQKMRGSGAAPAYNRGARKRQHMK